MLEAAKGLSVPVIAMVLLVQVMLQVMLPYIAKRKNGKSEDAPPQMTPEAIKEAAILCHQVAEIDKRTQSINDSMRELVQVNKETTSAIRDNTRALEKLTDKIER